jgi:hypothetical protein
MTKPNSALQAGGDETPVALLPFAILDDELTALLRFHETCMDSQAYDVPKAMMQRLATIGLVRRVTASMYEATTFGLSVINGDFTRPTPAAAAEVPTGYVLVPVEPTGAMLEAASVKFQQTVNSLGGFWAKTAAYKAMLAASPVAPAGVPKLSDLAIEKIAGDHGSRWRGPDEEGWNFDKHALLDFARAVLSAGAPAVPMQDSVHSHLADNGSSRALRAASQETPRPVADGESNARRVIRECGGIVHSDGNIFFTNRYQFEHAASLLCGTATVAVPSALTVGTPLSWQPIETAPKDRAFLAWVDDAIRVVRWGKTSHVPMYGFCLADQGAEDFDLCEPTHWMPLPPPPVQCDGRDGVTGSGASSENAKPLASSGSDGHGKDCA